MQLTSSAFENGSSIPQKYGRDFVNVNPPLTVTNVPKETVSLALIMDDPDIPTGFGFHIFDHWIVFNIPPTVTLIPEHWQVEGIRGVGTRGSLDYAGPRPPDREHRYFFKLFALDSVLDLPEGASKTQIMDAMQGHILDSAELMGTYAPTV